MDIAVIVALLLVGLLLLLLEIFVIPGVGVAGILGVGALGAGCYMCFKFGSTIGLCVTGGILLLVILLLAYALREKTWRRLALNDSVESTAGQDSAAVAAVGDAGVATTRLAPMGTAKISGKSLEVKSVAGFLDQGTEVEVVEIEDNVICVKPIKK